MLCRRNSSVHNILRRRTTECEHYIGILCRYRNDALTIRQRVQYNLPVGRFFFLNFFE